MRRVPSLLPALVLALLLAAAAWVSLGGGDRDERPGGHSSSSVPAIADRTDVPTTHDDSSTESPAIDADGVTDPTGPGSGLTGIVVDESGQPIPGARVEVHPATVPRVARTVLEIAPESLMDPDRDEATIAPPLGTGESGEDGRFEVPPTVIDPIRESMQYVRLCAVAEGFRLDPTSGWSGAIDLQQEPIEPITIKLTRSWTITGVLVDLDGAPVADHGVLLTNSSELAEDLLNRDLELLSRVARPTSAARTDAEGRFVLPGVLAGYARITSAEPHWLLSPERTPWFFDPAVEPTTWDAGTVVATPPRRVSIRAIDAVTGAVIPDATARAGRGETEIFGHVVMTGDPSAASLGPDAEGWIELPPLPPYLNSAELSAPGYFRKTVRLDFDPGTEVALEVELLPAARLAGRSVDFSGAPVVGAEVRLGRSDRPITERILVGFTGEDGSFFVDSHRPGTYDLSIDARTVVSVERSGITLIAGETLDLGTIRHSSGARLSGRVAFANGSAPDWAYVRLLGTTATGVRLHRRAPYEEGRFAFDGLPPGTYRVSIGYPDRDSRSNRHETEEVTIAGEEHRSLEVTIPDR